MRAVLVGDIGGTNARLALAWRQEDGVRLERAASLPVAAHAGLGEALEAWLDGAPAPARRAVFALAGPADAAHAALTNAAWTVDAADLKARFGFDSVTLVNDFVAMARAVPAAQPDAFETLIAGAGAPGAPMVVLGPGTGLGLATLLPQGGDWRVLASEGGHQAFAPADARERAILDLLAEDHAYVSFETLVSGRGLVRLYRALASLHDRPALLADAAAIGRAAVAGDDALATEAAQTLCLMLATFAGDAVLATGARAGCVIAGGVAEALAPFLRAPDVATRFAARGPMTGYLAGVPVRRLRDPLAALAGAAFFAPEATA